MMNKKQMPKNERPAGTNAEQKTDADCTDKSPYFGKPNVGG